MDILKDQAYEKELNKTRFKAIPAVFAVIEKDGCILLGKRADTGYMAGKYGLVSGHVDGGEPLKQAMIREIEEEVGLIVKAEDLDFVHISLNFYWYLAYFFPFGLQTKNSILQIPLPKEQSDNCLA